jgi:hypothetical protein
MILFVYYMFPLTEAPLSALFTLSPLWQLNVLSEALEEETDKFLVRLLLIDLVELYPTKVLGHTPH